MFMDAYPKSSSIDVSIESYYTSYAFPFGNSVPSIELNKSIFVLKHFTILISSVCVGMHYSYYVQIDVHLISRKWNPTYV